MTKLLACALMLAAATSAMAQERTITCDGPYRGERVGYCHLMDHIVLDEKLPKPIGIEKVNVCEMYERCVIRAKVIPSGNVEGHQNWTVLKVLSARRR